MGARILLAGGGTGGHLYPALNLAAALRRAEPRVDLFLLGASRGVEAELLPRTGHAYRLLPVQPLWRNRPWRNWRLVATAPAVMAGLAATFSGFDPELVVGTGGYASGPAVLWARITGRPTAIQEQNAEPGLVTRWLARFVDQVHLGYPEAEEGLSIGAGTRVFAYGNPVALGSPSAARRADPSSAEIPWPRGRVLLVTGGSQGARGLNERLLADFEEAALRGASWPLPDDVHVVWIAGPAHARPISPRIARLPWRRLLVVPFLEGLGGWLARVDLAIARAGAMFVAELAAAGVPAVLVPFPAAAGGHQTANARALAEAGAAIVREETELASGELLSLAAGILSDRSERDRMARAARARGAPEAADRIAAKLLSLVRARRGR